VAVFELLGGGQAGLQRGGGQSGQKRLRDGGVDRDTADAQVPGAAALDQLAGAGAVVTGRGFGWAVVVDSEVAPTLPAGHQAWEQRGAFPKRAGAGFVRHRMDVGADADLVGLVGVPVEEPAMVIFDEHLPLALRQLTAAGSHLAVLTDVALLAG